MSTKNLTSVLAASLLCAAGSAVAQIRPAYVYPTEPVRSGVQLGDTPAYLTPWVGFGAGYDDNLFLTPNVQKSSPLYVVSPGLRIDARSPNSVIQLYDQHQWGRYTESHNDDYMDYASRAQADMAFSGRAFARVGLEYVRGHDPRGSTDRSFSQTPDEYKVISPNATFAFGAPGAQGRAELYYQYQQKRYQNNRRTTETADRDNQEYGGALYVRVAPKTYVLGEMRWTDIDYKIAQPQFSGQEKRFYAGVSWEATAATTGTLKYGRLRREFDSGEASTHNSWEGIVTWLPRTYSTFDFYTSRQTNESTGQGRFILTSIYGVTWTHNWSSVLMTGVNARYQKDDYQGFNRDDETKSIGLKVGYKFRRWLTVGAEYTWTQRDSNLNNADYDKNLYLLTATISP